MHYRQKGFGIVGIIIALLALGILGLIGWRLYDQATSTTPPGADNTAATGPKRIVAVGDMVCDPNDSQANGADPNYCQDKKVAELVETINPDALLVLGDLQYTDGTYEKFQNAFDKNWGAFKPRMYPTPGNHEYDTPGATGYYTYFKDAPIDVSKGYYTFTLGNWRLFSLDSNCNEKNGCTPGSTQMAWLKQELDKNQAPCTLAFWHHPRFASGWYANRPEVKSQSDTMWPLLTDHKADVALVGHDHLYERYAKQTANGTPAAAGMRQFTVGTGGKSLNKKTVDAPTNEKAIDDHHGVLVMELHDNAYTWEFKSAITQQTLDSGRQACNG